MYLLKWWLMIRSFWIEILNLTKYLLYLPTSLQNLMKLYTLSLANQVPGWTSDRSGRSLSGTENGGGFCFVRPAAICSKSSTTLHRTQFACWNEKNKMLWYVVITNFTNHTYLLNHFIKLSNNFEWCFWTSERLTSNRFQLSI